MNLNLKRINPLQAVIWTQFLSAFADNLNFFLIVGMVTRQGGDNPDSSVALIQITLHLTYIALSPWVGAFADKQSKARVLLYGSLMKAAGIMLLLFGLPPAFCYVFVGIGSVVYSPAKYGILTELTSSEKELLQANAKVEGSTIIAILLGTISGGLLAKHSDLPAIIACLSVYLLSFFMALLIPARRGDASIRYGAEARVFLRNAARLFASHRGRFSLIGTGAFWLTASVLRIALIAWLPLNLGIQDTDQQSMIVGVTAVGVVISSLVTTRLVPEGKLHRASYYGLLMVLSVIGATQAADLWITASLLFLTGVFGGIFVIPLNTMLQEDGAAMIGPG